MLSTLKVFHSANGGNPDISRNLPGAAVTAFAAAGKKGVLAAREDKGFITVALATFAPMPTTFAPGFNNPYLTPRDNPFPNNGIAPPTKAPS